MFAAWLCLLACAPQEQDPVELMRALQRQLNEQASVAAIEKAVGGELPSRWPGFVAPVMATRLRESGLDALTTVRRELALDPAGEHLVGDALAKVGVVFGEARANPRPFTGDFHDFGDLCAEIHREMVQAIGSGREAERVIPSLRGTITAMTSRLHNLGSIEGDDATRMREQFERLAKVEHARIRQLAMRLVEAALTLDRESLIERARKEPRSQPRADGIVQGDVLLDRDSAFGRMVIGGFGRNTYDCSQLDVIIDLGGDDEYRGRIAGAGDRSRVAVVVDLAGNDTYLADNDALGSATLGIGVFVDFAGDDHYEAQSRCCGFALAGFGAFVDLGGDDSYKLGDMSAGCAIAGTGLFLDAAGDDRATAGVLSFGVGLPGGAGLCFDLSGNDLRRAGRRAKTVAADGEVDVSAAFGVGLGAPPLMAPGLGLCLDLRGNDRSEGAGVCGGVGVRGGVGILIDQGGDDTVLCGDVALGAAYGQGLGIAIDEAGDDVRAAGRFALGCATDEALGICFDAAGNDREVASAPALGAAERHAEAVHLDLAGVDAYDLESDGQPFRIASLRPAEGPALGVFLHLGGGDDSYAFHGVPRPENNRTRMSTGGERSSPSKQVFVDR